MRMFNIDKFEELTPACSGLVTYRADMASTSDYAKMLADQGAISGSIVITDYQTAGRGRRENGWSCEPGEGLLFSLILEPEVDRSTWGQFGLAVGVAIAEVLESYGVAAKIKWPNDIWIHGKKCAGILVETLQDRLVVGVGLNVSAKEFSDDVQQGATSLFLEGVQEVDRELLLSQLVQSIIKWSSLCGGENSGLIRKGLQQRCALTGNQIQLDIEGVTVIGKALGVNYDGALVIEVAGEVRMIHTASKVRVV
mgnify:CR=1 FL=1